jgi:hypothetical protein
VEGRLLDLKVEERGESAGDAGRGLADDDSKLFNERPGLMERRFSCRDEETVRAADAGVESSCGNNAFNGRTPSSKLFLRESESPSEGDAGGRGSVVFFVGLDRASAGGWKTGIGRGSSSRSGGATLNEGDGRGCGVGADAFCLAYDGSPASNASLIYGPDRCLGGERTASGPRDRGVEAEADDPGMSLGPSPGDGWRGLEWCRS